MRRPGGRLLAERRLIDEAHRLADVVIIDTAPLPAASLTCELSTMVDTVLVVSRVGRTTAANAERCADLLEQLGAPTLGVVMVGVTTPLFSDYFSYAAPRRHDGSRRTRPRPRKHAQIDHRAHEQPDLRQPGRHAPPARPVGAGPVEPPGNDR